MQRPPYLAARQRGIGGASAFAGRVDLPGDDRVECRVVSLGARHKEVEELDATNAPVADLASKAGCRGNGALIHVSSLPIVQSGTLTAASNRRTRGRQAQCGQSS